MPSRRPQRGRRERRRPWALCAALALSLALGALPASATSPSPPLPPLPPLPEPLSPLLPGPLGTAGWDLPPLPEPLQGIVEGLLAPTSPPASAPAQAAELPPFWGLGAWVDLFDYGHPGNFTPEAIVDELHVRGVRTVYVQTARWNSAADIVDPGALGGFVERAHAHGMKVVGWYLPGFANVEVDVIRSLAVLRYTSPNGHHLDGLAPDIEDRAAVGGNRDAFNAGVTAYSQRLRGAVPPGTVLAAIVPDARNNERARSWWAGFPWPEIARYYDVVMPMAYWSVTKPMKRCTSIQMDAGGYIADVVSKTVALMGTSRPMHVIGGIADCVTPEEVAAYVGAVKGAGAIGGGLYDYMTNTEHQHREPIWIAQLGLR